MESVSQLQLDIASAVDSRVVGRTSLESVVLLEATLPQQRGDKPRGESREF